MSSVISSGTNTTNLHLISPAVENRRIVVMQTAFPLDFSTHIFHCVSALGGHCVVIPSVRLTVGSVTGQADLHSCGLMTNVTEKIMFSVFK